MRTARRQRRLASVDWFDALYKVYIGALLGGIAVVAAVNVVGGEKIAPTSLPAVRGHGPAVVGLVVAALVLLGARSGARGGPLGVEQADVRYLFLAPVPRAAVVRPMAVRYVQSRVLGGAIVGASAGLVVMHRLPGAAAAWIATGALVGGAASMLTTGTAMVISGTRVSRGLANLIGVAAVGWSALDVVRPATTSPFTALGMVALLPVRSSSTVLTMLAVAAAIGAGVVGVAAAPGLSVEAAERRSKLVGELRFATTMRDFRTALVLQRQLSQDQPRETPWVRLSTKGFVRWPVWRRDWRGVLRWPLARGGRVVAAGVIAGAAAAGASSTRPLLLVACLAIWVGAQDAIEPLAQEVDHPSLGSQHPVDAGRVHVRHLVVPGLVMLLPAVAAVVTAALVGHVHAPVAELAVIALAAATTSVCGAAVTVVKGPPPVFDPVNLLVPPELAGMRQLEQFAWPVLLSGCSLGGIVAVVPSSADQMNVHLSPVGVAAGVLGVAAVVVGGTSAWLVSRLGSGGGRARGWLSTSWTTS